MSDRERWVYTGFLMLLVAAMLGFWLAVMWLNVTRPISVIESCTEVTVKRGP